MKASRACLTSPCRGRTDQFQPCSQLSIAATLVLPAFCLKSLDLIEVLQDWLHLPVQLVQNVLKLDTSTRGSQFTPIA